MSRTSWVMNNYALWCAHCGRTVEGQSWESSPWQRRFRMRARDILEWHRYGRKDCIA